MKISNDINCQRKKTSKLIKIGGGGVLKLNQLMLNSIQPIGD